MYTGSDLLIHFESRRRSQHLNRNVGNEITKNSDRALGSYRTQENDTVKKSIIHVCERAHTKCHIITMFSWCLLLQSGLQSSVHMQLLLSYADIANDIADMRHFPFYSTYDLRRTHLTGDKRRLWSPSIHQLRVGALHSNSASEGTIGSMNLSPQIFLVYFPTHITPATMADDDTIIERTWIVRVPTLLDGDHQDLVTLVWKYSRYMIRLALALPIAKGESLHRQFGRIRWILICLSIFDKGR